MKSFVALAIVVAACGGDDGGTHHDAATAGDGSGSSDASVSDAMPADAPGDAQAFVLTVTCDGTAKGPITTNGFAFDPNTLTINVGEMVRFTMPVNHNVVPDPTAALTDPGLRVDFNEDKCLQFTATGTFGYKCQPHGFKGSITVQ